MHDIADLESRGLPGVGVASSEFVQAAAAQAQPGKYGLCYDLSKAYTFVTPQIVLAAKDYADILNAKGGILDDLMISHRSDHLLLVVNLVLHLQTLQHQKQKQNQLLKLQHQKHSRPAKKHLPQKANQQAARPQTPTQQTKKTKQTHKYSKTNTDQRCLERRAAASCSATRTRCRRRRRR